jgi:hypothetical protein
MIPWGWAPYLLGSGELARADKPVLPLVLSENPLIAHHYLASAYDQEEVRPVK